MQPGWYIVNYHNVDWENSLFTRGFGGTVRPDVFRQQLQAFALRGDLVSPQDALARLTRGDDFERPAFSLWFDDGFRGVRKYALPICREFGITAAQSINSRFVLREEMFWLGKMSYLAGTDGLRFLRSRFRKLHADMPPRIRKWTIENCSGELVQAVGEVYERFTTDAVRQDAFRIYDDQQGVQQLADAGWMIVNHSAAHYALTPAAGWDSVEQQFDECEQLVRRYHEANRYWVVPFGYGAEHYLPRLKERAVVVHVGARVNTAASFAGGEIFRFGEPQGRAAKFA